MSPVGSLAAPQAAAVPKVPYHPPSQSTSQKCAISPGPEGLVSPRTKMTPLLHDRDVSIRPATDTPCPQWGWHSCLLEAQDPADPGTGCPHAEDHQPHTVCPSATQQTLDACRVTPHRQSDVMAQPWGGDGAGRGTRCVCCCSLQALV